VENFFHRQQKKQELLFFPLHIMFFSPGCRMTEYLYSDIQWIVRSYSVLQISSEIDFV